MGPHGMPSKITRFGGEIFFLWKFKIQVFLEDRDMEHHLWRGGEA
jgi:hypothetical protein